MRRFTIRFRLQRRRFRSRRLKGLWLAVTLATLTTLLEWSGYFGFKYSGQIRPQALADVWWHFFLWTAFYFCAFVFWPFSLADRYGNSLDD